MTLLSMKVCGKISVDSNGKKIYMSSLLSLLTIVKSSRKYPIRYGSDVTSWPCMIWQESRRNKSTRLTSPTIQMKSFISSSRKFLNMLRKKKHSTKLSLLFKEITKRCQYTFMRKYFCTGRFSFTSETITRKKIMKNWRISMICCRWKIMSCLGNFLSLRKWKKDVY